MNCTSNEFNVTFVRSKVRFDIFRTFELMRWDQLWHWKTWRTISNSMEAILFYSQDIVVLAKIWEESIWWKIAALFFWLSDSNSLLSTSCTVPKSGTKKRKQHGQLYITLWRLISNLTAFRQQCLRLRNLRHAFRYSVVTRPSDTPPPLLESM